MNDNNLNQFENQNGYNNNRGDGQGNGGNNNGNQPPRKPSLLWLIMTLLSVGLMFYVSYSLLFGGLDNVEEVSYTQFLQDLEDGKVESVEVDAENVKILVTLKEEEKQEKPYFVIPVDYTLLIINTPL